MAIGERVEPDEADATDQVAATQAAALAPGATVGQAGILYWETMTGSRRALTAVRAAVKAAQAGKPWPEWALQAKAQGWTPPKGWTP